MGFRRFISISRSHRPIFTTLGEIADADDKIAPQHFGSDPAEIRIRINPEIWIRIPGNFWVDR